jgi:hypothetical protein
MSEGSTRCGSLYGLFELTTVPSMKAMLDPRIVAESGEGKPYQHCRLHDGDYLSSLGAQHRKAENTLAPRLDERLHEATRLSDGSCAQDRGHR